MGTALTPTTSGVLLREAVPEQGLKILAVELPATVDDGDTFAIDLSTYGGSTFIGHQGFIQTTANSVIVAETNTTAVSGTTLTVTIGGSTDNKKRTLIIYYY